MTTAVCPWSTREDVCEQYVRGALSPEEREAFEEHYFTCAACLARVRACDLLRDELSASGAEAPAPQPVRARPWRWVLVPAAAAIVLVAATAIWVSRPGPIPSGPAVAVAPAPEPPVTRAAPPAPAAASPVAAQPQPAPIPRQPGSVEPAATRPSQPESPPVVALSVLARVEPPPYAPVVLRGPRDEAAVKFDEAMRLYVKRNYAGALPGLGAAVALRPDQPQYAFFLGVCRLLADQTETAIAGLQQTIALGESPYLEEAHFYLAKARLRQGDIAGARQELERVVQRRRRLEHDARRLLAQIDALARKR